MKVIKHTVETLFRFCQNIFLEKKIKSWIVILIDPSHQEQHSAVKQQLYGELFVKYFWNTISIFLKGGKYWIIN